MADESPSQKRSVFANIWSLVVPTLDLVMDFSFKKFVTPKLIRVIYALSLLAALLFALTWMVGGFKIGITYGLFTLVTAPLAFLFYALFARMTMELVLAIFSIAEEVKKLNERNDTGSGKVIDPDRPL